ncbi:MAG: hypothetical protein IPH35_00455 [Rhodoferax sp.]|nr:hypothetical protein [Rhodoferax sp.]
MNTNTSLTNTPVAGTTIPPDPLPAGSTGTGLDQLVEVITKDPGLLKKVSYAEIAAGAQAADALNALVIESIRATGVANDGVLTVGDVRDMNTYLRAHHLDTWTTLHGDDANGVETGFHLVQNDGAKTRLFDHNAVNTVADGLYHLGFEIRDNRLLNEDGNPNAHLESVTEWLNSLLANDLAGDKLDNAAVNPYAMGTTGTGLDQLVDLITQDPGLNKKIATSEIYAGATAADALNALVVESIRATGVANDGILTVGDVRDMNTYLRAHHLNTWTTLHGDDEDGEETGFHLVQNDGAKTRLFDHNAVNTVADGLYHLGFEICDNRLLNEDGNPNAHLKSVTEWLNSLLANDLAGDKLDNAAVNPYAMGTTGTGLDQLVDLITQDSGLNKKIATSEIYAGARAADKMNAIIVAGIRATSAADGGVIEVSEVKDINRYIRANHLEEWSTLHGDDEEGVETGFHLVQKDGGETKLFDLNAINRVADGLYHMGFEINAKGRFLNEDGDSNESVTKVAQWLNLLLADDLADGALLVQTVGVPAATQEFIA